MHNGLATDLELLARAIDDRLEDAGVFCIWWGTQVDIFQGMDNEEIGDRLGTITLQEDRLVLDCACQIEEIGFDTHDPIGTVLARLYISLGAVDACATMAPCPPPSSSSTC